MHQEYTRNFSKIVIFIYVFFHWLQMMNTCMSVHTEIGIKHTTDSDHGPTQP